MTNPPSVREIAIAIPGDMSGACGAGCVHHARMGASTRIEDAIGPRVLVRSGTWTGWRALGGE